LKKLLFTCGELSTCENKIEMIAGDALNHATAKTKALINDNAGKISLR
jgi:hypothetical protein